MAGYVLFRTQSAVSFDDGLDVNRTVAEDCFEPLRDLRIF